jgi:hypothetical protein
MKQHVAADLRASPSINREAAYGNKSQSNFSLPTLVGQPFPIERDHHPLGMREKSPYISYRSLLFFFIFFLTGAVSEKQMRGKNELHTFPLCLVLLS